MRYVNSIRRGRSDFTGPILRLRASATELFGRRAPDRCSMSRDRPKRSKCMNSGRPAAEGLGVRVIESPRAFDCNRVVRGDAVPLLAGSSRFKLAGRLNTDWDLKNSKF